MARVKATRAYPIPGAGTIFALRAIGLVLSARWLFSMSKTGYEASLSAILASPWACLNLIFLFLLIVLPGAQARAERPFHPLPRWLRQTLHFLAALGLLFAIGSIGAFVWVAGWRGTVDAITATNGWVAVAPGLYAAVFWVCRPRALWRTHITAQRFALGRYAIALDTTTHTAIVWVESRKLGQYDTRELSLKWSAPTRYAQSSMCHIPTQALIPPKCRTAYFKIELLWNSPAAAGHNRQTVFRVKLASHAHLVAAQALDAILTAEGNLPFTPLAHET